MWPVPGRLSAEEYGAIESYASLARTESVYLDKYKN